MVIGDSNYPLAKDYRHIFLADNNTCSEIIWPLVQDGLRAQSSAGTNFYVKAFVNGPMDELYQTGVGSKGWGNVRSKTTLVDAFDADDVQFDVNDTWGNNKKDKRASFMTALPNQTKETWDATGNMTSTFTCGYGYIKWRNVTKDDQICASGDTYSSIDFPLFRTADAYLMAAEAILRGANGSKADALDYVNKVRARAYMSDEYAVPGVRSDVSGKIDMAQLNLDFILAERQRELASECQRRTDLIRFGKFTTGNNWDWKAAERNGADVDKHLVLFPFRQVRLQLILLLNKILDIHYNSKMKKALVLISLISLFLVSLPVIGQTSREEIFETIEKGGGVYYAYPGPSANNNTPAPKGYKPFYISHYGRHGSRYLISGKDYTSVLAVFDKAHAAGALTALGEDVRTRLLRYVRKEQRLQEDLTPLGRRQHRGIAERMFRSFPEVFADGDSISARSTVVPRCAMSMVAFGDRLKELNPKLNILYEMSDRYMGYMNYHTDK